MIPQKKGDAVTVSDDEHPRATSVEALAKLKGVVRPDGSERIVFGLGCFWGAERKFWQTDGVYSTAVGYAGGYTPNPTYEETCSGRTGQRNQLRMLLDRHAA